MDLVERAARILKHDGLVVYPTDTIYGLGADALSDEAIIKVYEAKRRPIAQPISVAVCDMEMAHGIARIDHRSSAFMERFFPGPVTVVVPARNSLPEILTGGTGMVGIRFPAHPVAISLIELFDSPITATSANIHGARDPVTPDECHVMHDLLLDAGKLPGIASTVVDVVNGVIIRRGTGADAVDAFLKTL
ncbi:MAG: L-threonylcarbamoyladenylate synthase [Methanolinea sp.]|jgi:L-threonylcarbamoyladenylate synthase|nr:L-threonylcarbamoyladenylate synthase [Methanolinea sp.]